MSGYPRKRQLARAFLERSYAKEFHNRSFGEYSDSIVLMLVQAGSGKVDQIYCTDRAYDMYSPG